MANTNTDNATLTSYAQAILGIADSKGITQQIADEISGIAAIIKSDAAFAKFLADPSVGNSVREQTIERVFGSQINPSLVAFLKLLNSKDRLGDFPGIADAVKEILDKRSGNVEVEVTVPQALNDHELENVRQQISQKLGKNAVVKQTVDESLIGGLVLKIGDSLIDGSVKTQLETLKKRLVAAV